MKQRIGFRLNINEKKVIFEKEMKTFSYDLDLFFYFIYSLKIKTQKALKFISFYENIFIFFSKLNY